MHISQNYFKSATKRNAKNFGKYAYCYFEFFFFAHSNTITEAVC